MDPMTVAQDPEPGQFYVISITFKDGSKATAIGKFRGYDGGLALWETPKYLDKHGAAEVEILRVIPNE